MKQTTPLIRQKYIFRRLIVYVLIIRMYSKKSVTVCVSITFLDLLGKLLPSFIGDRQNEK